jgi:hypothetical protein
MGKKYVTDLCICPSQFLTAPYWIEQNDEDVVILDIDSEGKMFTKSQAMDYALRGDSLSEYNVYEFFVDTYEEQITGAGRTRANNPVQGFRGRPKHERIPYYPEHLKHESVHRVMRSADHNNLPNIIGRFFPRRDDPDTYPFYCASMLLLLKPWRNIETDLKLPSETWEDAFDSLMKTAPRKYQRIVSGIQYFHDCENSAKDRRVEENAMLNEYNQDSENIDTGIYDTEDVIEHAGVLTEEYVRKIEEDTTPTREADNGRQAVQIAKLARIFPDDTNRWQVDHVNPTNATGEDLRMLLEWKLQMKNDVAKQNETNHSVNTNEAGTVTNLTTPIIEHITGNNYTPDEPNSEEALQAVDVSHLTSDQYRAYDIVRSHLEQTLLGKPPPPLRMIIHGEGGTGKSRVIQTITETFAQKGVSFMLKKAAYTGIAASLINGKTTHGIALLSIRPGMTMSDETKKKLQDFWQSCLYLIIDEYSMLSKTFLAQLSRNIAIAFAETGQHSDQSFGGINVILCGDLHQFPPVATSPHEALFYPSNPLDSTDSQIGRAIYEEFQTVVILKQQHRITDDVWKDFLQRLRNGVVQERDIHMLKKQVIGNPETEEVDFNAYPWNEASLVTPRHAVRNEWNASAVRKWCQVSKQRLYVCRAEDTTNGRPLSQTERYVAALKKRGEGRRKRKDLPKTLEIAKGMKVMVTSNIETDLDVANGARGEIVDIILHPDEPPIGDGPICELKYLPSYILVRLSRTRATKLEGLEEAVIPVEPASIKYQIKIKNTQNKIITRTVTRRQFPMTAAYSFTDYRSQGQTLPFVIVDIGRTPTGTLTLFNLYVALSRSSGRSTIRLLRDFDQNIFLKAHSPTLISEDDRLERLNTHTKNWWGQNV